MGKWLAIAGIALLALLFVMWKQLDSSSATAAPSAPPPAASETAIAANPVAVTSGAPARAAAVVAAPVETAPDKPEKIDVESDAFFYQFQEMVPARLSRNAVKCYEGISKRVHRNQSMTVDFKIKIKDGVVTISDLKVAKDTLDNPALSTCFMQEVVRTTWTDDSLPDWEAEDQLTLNPERGLKKYTRENIEYVGEPAPRD